MAGELDVGSIVMRIRADASGVQEGLAQLQAAMGQTQEKVQQSGKGIGDTYTKMGQSAQASAAAQAAAAGAMAAAAAKAFAVIVGAIDAGIKAMNRYQAALIGVNSVAKGRGISEAELTSALNNVTDAFLDAGSASTAFKNLLARGYDIEQATNAILQLKDAAAFGRQASLGLADAVVSATEGLKNENSILVDNAGVTKNVSVMWQEYAASIGTTVDKLTLAQKIEAEVAGIRNETRFQTGDLAKLQDTLAGAQAKTAMSGEFLARAYGNAMAPAVQMVTEVFGEFLNGLTEIVNAAPELVAGLTGAGVAITGLLVAQKAIVAFKAMSTALQAMTANVTIFGVAVNSALPWLAALGAVVGIATAGYTYFNRVQQKAAEEAAQAAEKEAERKQALEDSVSELTALRDRYVELSQKTRRTYAESQEMKTIEAQLAEQYGITGSALEKQGEKYDWLTGKINETIAAKLRELQISKDADAASAAATYKDAQAKATAAREYIKIAEQLTQTEKTYREEREAAEKSGGYQGVYDFDRGRGKELLKEIEDIALAGQKLLDDSGLVAADIKQYEVRAKEAAAEMAKAYIAATINEFEANGGQINSAYKNTLDKFFIGLTQSPTSAMHFNPDAMSDVYEDAIANMDMSGAVAAMSEINTKIWSGMEPKDSDLQTLEKGFGVIEAFALQMKETLHLTDEQALDLIKSMVPVGAHLIESWDGLKDVPKTIIDRWKETNLSGFIRAEGQDLADAITESRKAITEQERFMGDLGNSIKGGADVIKALQDLITGFETGNDELVKAATESLEGLGIDAPKSLETARKALESRVKIQADFKAQMDTQYREMMDMRKTFQTQLSALEEEGRGDSAEAKSLKAFIAMIDEANRAAAAALTYGGMPTIIKEEDIKVFNAATASMAELSAEQANLARGGQESSDKVKDLTEKIRNLQIIQDGLKSGNTDSEVFKGAMEFLQQYDEFALMTLDNLDSVNVAMSSQEAILAGVLSTMTGQIAQMQTLLDEWKVRAATMTDGAEKTELTGKIAELEQTIKAYETLLKAPTALLKIPVQVELSGADAVRKEIETLKTNAARAQKGIETIGVKRGQIADAKMMVAETIRLEKAGKSAGEEWRQNVNKALGREFKGSAQEAQTALDNLDLSLQGNIDSMTAELENTKAQLEAMASGIVAGTIDVTVGGTVDASVILSALDAEIAAIDAKLALFGASLTTSPSTAKRGGGGGGGGGGNKDKGNSSFKAAIDALQHQVAMGRKGLQAELNALLVLQKKYWSTLNKDERLDLEKRIYDAREAVRQANLSRDQDALEHRKNMGRLTLQAEITTLQKILREHKLNAEERRSILEQLYQAQESLRQENLNKELRRISHLVTMNKMSASEEIKALEAVLAKHKLTKDERMDITEQLAAAQERMRSEQLQWDLALLDHSVAMGKTSAQQEIARLLEIKNAHVLTAEEIMQIDERIYRLQNQRSQDEVSRTKTAYDQLVAALKNRLSEQKKLEDAALDERIEALNELTKAENEAKRADDYAQNLADKQRELSVEKSARRRRELNEEIAKMEADEALRLRQLARQDEIDALKEQKDAVSKKYEQLTSEENLRQEALRLVMSNNLQEMTNLISSYGNQWQDAGAKLAQALSDGLIGNSGAIMETIQKLNDAIQEGINEQLMTIGRTVPNTLGGGGVVIQLYGTTIREDADIDRLADEMYGRIQAAGR